MPIPTEISSAIANFRKGDTFILGNAEYTVVSVNKKSVWAYVYVEEQDSPIRLRMDDVYSITRMVKTDEEIAAERDEFLYKMVAQKIAEAPAAVAEAKKKLISNLDILDAWSASYYENFLATQTTSELWSHVAQRAEKTGEDLVTAYRALLDYERTRLLESDFMPRSTSMARNFGDAAIKEATRKWVQHAVWF